MNGSLLTMETEARLSDGEVCVGQDGRITYAGARRADAEAPQDLPVVDARGGTILPGLIDAHVHFQLAPEGNPFVTGIMRPYSYLMLRVAQAMRDTLHAGVTTARDLGGVDRGPALAVNDGLVEGPRTKQSIAILSPTGGPGDLTLPNGFSADQLTHVIQPVASAVDTDDEARLAVRKLVRAGADVIMVCTSGRFGHPMESPDDIGFSEEQVRVIVEELSSRGKLPVAANAMRPAGVLAAVRGGASSIEHGYHLDKECVDAMLESGTWLVPALGRLHVPDPPGGPALPPQMKKAWAEGAKASISLALASGVPVAMGSMAGVTPHGRNLSELSHLQELGMSPVDALKAATVNAARLLRMESEVGTLAEGKLGDVVVVAGDPLQDAGVLADPSNVRFVAKEGTIVKHTLEHS
ncbi:amidohydrolase family protein [Streptomyces sp. NPDC058045]|uniref:metal-dependent hydrolase family protein n=1 Tax=Streptomyces sp. NPDC058045 TaxID=3346311 RepID=UPI0036E820CB